jgi:hypothetical protein
VKRPRQEEAGSAARQAPRLSDEVREDFEVAAVMFARGAELDRDREQPVLLPVEAGVGMPGLEMVARPVAQDLDGLGHWRDVDSQLRRRFHKQAVEPVEQPRRLRTPLLQGDEYPSGEVGWQVVRAAIDGRLLERPGLRERDQPPNVEALRATGRPR